MEKQYKPSAWENPEYYESADIPIEPQRERTLQEFIQIKLFESGFSIDNHPDGILAWPRNADPDVNSYVIGPKKDIFAVKSAKGTFTRKKTRQAMDAYLKNWCDLYKIGARK